MQNLLEQKGMCSLSSRNPSKTFDHFPAAAFESPQDAALQFINAGIGCNCLVALWEAGILSKFLENDELNEMNLKDFGNEICIKSAFSTLVNCKVFKRDNGVYRITKFGKSLAEYIGLVTIFFDGYGELVLNQTKIVKKRLDCPEKLVKWPAVASSSIWISSKAVDPILIEEFIQLNIQGTICDLGCGCGVMLSKLCKATNNSGLGFEGNLKTVMEVKAQLHEHISIEVADISALHGIWEDVTSLVQAFVCHDFNPSEKCVGIINSYLENFPNLKYFFYIDIVSPSESNDRIFPGFDYVHGLLGIPTRTYEETLQMFEQSRYGIYKEIRIPDLPNAFLWILSPKRGV